MDIAELLHYFNYAMGLLSQLFQHLPRLFSWLPGSVTVLVLPALSVAVAYRVLGWGD